MMALFSLVRRGKTRLPPAPPRLRAPLPAKVLTELVGLDAMQSRRPEDRRRRPRLDRASDITIDADLPTGPATLATQVCDMSAEGLSLIVKTALPPGTSFHTTLACMNGEGFVDLTATVRRCDAQPNGRFLIGGAFIDYRVYATRI